MGDSNLLVTIEDSWWNFGFSMTDFGSQHLYWWCSLTFMPAKSAGEFGSTESILANGFSSCSTLKKMTPISIYSFYP